jgi:hypothetical protein
MKKRLAILSFVAVLAGAVFMSTSGATGAQTVSSITVAVGGDICEGNSTDAQRCKATSDLILARNPNYVLTLGDNQYHNPSGQATLSDFNTWYTPQWGRFKSKTFPSPGNHDRFGPSGYDEYFDGSAAGASVPRRYKRDLGSWRIHSLDSNGSTQITNSNTFLNNALPSPDFDIVFWHHARYSSGTDQGSNTAVERLWETAKQGPSLVLYAHDHTYERGTTEGQHWWLSGLAGAEQHDDFCDATRVPGSQRCIDQQLGVLFFTLNSDGSYSFQLVAPSGTVLDSGSGTLSA